MTLYICAVTIMVNLTTLPWNSQDLATKKRSVKFCKKENRCLKKFIKKEGIHYYAICSERFGK